MIVTLLGLIFLVLILGTDNFLILAGMLIKLSLWIIVIGVVLSVVFAASV